MSDTVLGWLFGGWSFGRSPDETSVRRDRTTRLNDRETGARVVEADDDRIVAQVRAGDAAVFKELFLHYYAPLVGFATSYVGSMDDGEEIVADVFARVWEHRSTWMTTSGVAAYFFSAVRNRAFNAVRNRSRGERQRATLQELGETPGIAVPSRDLAEQVERDDHVAAALQLMARLPERQRLILSLRWTYDLTWDEIAVVLGVTSTAVRKEHSRILASLRAELQAK